MIEKSEAFQVSDPTEGLTVAAWASNESLIHQCVSPAVPKSMLRLVLWKAVSLLSKLESGVLHDSC